MSQNPFRAAKPLNFRKIALPAKEGMPLDARRLPLAWRSSGGWPGMQIFYHFLFVFKGFKFEIILRFCAHLQCLQPALHCGLLARAGPVAASRERPRGGCAGHRVPERRLDENAAPQLPQQLFKHVRLQLPQRGDQHLQPVRIIRNVRNAVSRQQHARLLWNQHLMSWRLYK